MPPLWGSWPRATTDIPFFAWYRTRCQAFVFERKEKGVAADPPGGSAVPKGGPKTFRAGWMVPLALLLLSVQWAAAGAPTGVRTVYVVPIKGTVEPGLASFVERSLSTAEKEKADAVLLEINSFGGRVDAATEIRDMILEFEPPVLAYVSERAWSAAALIAIASPKLAMAPGASIGAAEPRPAEEKTISALRAEFEATAERNGRDPRIAGAMVDAELEIKDVVGKGKILTLSAEQAEKLGFVDYVAPRRQTVLAYFGYPGARLVVMRPAGAERMARFITDPVVSSLLLTVGFLGLLYELASGGWGVPGSVSLAALGLFFGGRLVAGLAGWEVLVLFLAGLGLLFLEASVIPGFGVAGFAGAIAVVSSLYFSFADARNAFYSIGASLLTALLIGAFTVKYVRRTRSWDRIVLRTRFDTEKGYTAASTVPDLAGQAGRSLTVLRPAGIVEIGDMRVDAVSEGGFVEAGRAVKVQRVEGNRVVVREVRGG